MSSRYRALTTVSTSRASGKTSFYNKYFKPHDYVHVNQDTLRSRDKCLAVVRETITFGKTGCVVGKSILASAISSDYKGYPAVSDNTNRDAATRSLYVAMAKQLGVPIRCFFFTASYNLAKHNNHYRAWYAKNVPEAEVRSLVRPQPSLNSSCPWSRDVPSYQRQRLSDSRTPCRSRMTEKGLMRSDGSTLRLMVPRRIGNSGRSGCGRVLSPSVTVVCGTARAPLASPNRYNG